MATAPGPDMPGMTPSRLAARPAMLRPPILSATEAKHLWWFFDGAIMDVATRHHLWDSWGFCGRHAWAHLVAECELRYIPLSTAILYRDLAERAQHLLAHPLRAPNLTHRLRSHASCFTCDYVSTSVGIIEPSFADHAQRVNRHVRWDELFGLDEPTYARLACPRCVPIASGALCRPCLTEEGELRRQAEAAHAHLTDLIARLSVYEKSLTWHGARARAAHRYSLLATVGGVAGWPHLVITTEGSSDIPPHDAIIGPSSTQVGEPRAPWSLP